MARVRFLSSRKINIEIKKHRQGLNEIDFLSIANETDFLSVTLTAQLQCLIYCTLVANWKPETGVSDSENPTAKNPQKPRKQPEEPGLNKLVWWKSENRTHGNKKWCFFPQESGPGVLYDHESTLPTTWYNKYCFKMTQNTLSWWNCQRGAWATRTPLQRTRKFWQPRIKPDTSLSTYYSSGRLYTTPRLTQCGAPSA